MERRPVWLLPVLYRVWAAGRARAMAAWCTSWHGTPPAGAEDHAWALALDLEAAEAAGAEVAGAALDWRKAFDRVRLGTLAAVLRRAGVPAWLAGPMLSAYTADRRLRVAGALGGA